MTLRVRVWTPYEVSVHTEPCRLLRLLGYEAQDRYAIGVPAIAGGTQWVWDSTSRHITDARVLDAIERAVTRWLAEQQVPRPVSTGPPGNGPPRDAA